MKKLLIVYILFMIHLSDTAHSQWATYNLPYDGIAYTLGFYDANRGVSCGHTFMTFSEKLFYTSNSGVNWIQANYPPEIRALGDVQFINATTVYACGSQNGFTGNSKGYTAGFDYLPALVRNSLIYKGVSEFNAENYKCAFLKSTDSGANWVKAGQFDSTMGYMNNIHFFNSSTGYAVIDTNPSGNPKFYKTTNAGQNWIFVSKIEQGTALDNMHFFNTNTGIVSGHKIGGGPAGIYGVMFKTTNGGLSWTKTTFNNVSQITCFSFFNSSAGVAMGITSSVIGVQGITKIFKTNNGGNSWDSVGYIMNKAMSNIRCLPSTGIAFAVGNVIDSVSGFGKIATAKTTDYGLSWVLKDLSPIVLMTGIELIDQNNFFISGGFYSAVIYKSTNGGNVFVNNTGNEIPAEYALHQNYPNPFNPSTKIKFELPKAGLVKISVFDVTGREVAVLVNETLQAEVYETAFDARGQGSELTSGVYFCRMEAGSFKETRKMILIR